MIQNQALLSLRLGFTKQLSHSFIFFCPLNPSPTSYYQGVQHCCHMTYLTNSANYVKYILFQTDKYNASSLSLNIWPQCGMVLGKAYFLTEFKLNQNLMTILILYLYIHYSMTCLHLFLDLFLSWGKSSQRNSFPIWKKSEVKVSPNSSVICEGLCDVSTYQHQIFASLFRQPHFLFFLFQQTEHHSVAFGLMMNIH